MEILQTNISQAFWCTLKENKAIFEPAEVAMGKGNLETISWLDKLFEGGIAIPEGDGKPLTFLITGPPGSGKSTFALELCYRLVKNKANETPFSLYISIDAEANQVINNAKSFGYNEVEKYIINYRDYSHSNAGINNNVVAVCGRNEINKAEKEADLSQIVKTALEGIGQLFNGNTNIDPSLDILVIDSLNIVKPKDKGMLFQEFLQIASGKAKIIIFVLDSDSSNGVHKFWEYVCDIVVRLDYRTLQDYYIRGIEVVKARYQSHVVGRHQMKIYQKFASQESGKNNEELRRSHPYRKEGGIFIFPSIHYYLSLYKKRVEGEKTVGRVKLPIENLHKVLEEGLPEGRCTAFIGCRGGHKSHLGYRHILSRIIEGEGGLVISLRDDEEMTRTTMRKILVRELNSSEKKLNDFENQNKLEILYYHPGYITPEEFFHRMFMSIHRLKKDNKKLTVLFNSLDQLSARFPLCAKQEIFIPGIIECFSGEGITSIFIAVDEQGQPVEQYGLLPMADLILSFSQREFSVEEYHGHLEEEAKTNLTSNAIKEQLGIHPQAVVLRIVRFAGGQSAGAGGILELVKQDKPLYNIYKEKEGLHFTPFSPKFSQGKLICDWGQTRKQN